MNAWAEAYQAIGWPVFPVKGKIPLAEHGFKDAKLEPWDWPQNATGIGLATGKVSGVFVVDLDSDDAMRSFLAMQTEHGARIRTVAAKTYRGYHAYLRMPVVGDVRTTVGKLAKGLDVKAEGGYVILPPSKHPSGSIYEWVAGRSPDEIEIAEAPDWLLDLVRPPAPKLHVPPPVSVTHGTSYVAAAIRGECAELARTPKGSRNHQLNIAAFSLARFVADGKIDAPTVARALAHAATEAGLPSYRILPTIRSAFRGRGVAA